MKKIEEKMLALGVNFRDVVGPINTVGRQADRADTPMN